MKMKRKMKVIPHCYKKRGSRTLSNSLSQLLQIGSYRKRINDLTTNNRLLTRALQESLIEAASQSNLLKNYAREANQILYARIKLNEMAKNLAKFATDLEEVRECLDVSLPSECNFFQKKGSSNERIIKVPDVSCIHEELELSENEATPYEESSDDAFMNDLEKDVASVNHNIEMTPILFANDGEESEKKKSNSTYKGSLTPQLNIDFTFVNKRRSTRSRGKTLSLGKKNSKSGELVSHKKSESPLSIHEIQDCVELNKVILKSPVNIESIEKESENAKIPFENFSDEFADIDCNDCSVIQSSSFVIKDKELVLDIDSNQLSELKKEVCRLQSQNNENNSHFEDSSEIHRNVLEEKRLSVNDKLYAENNSEKLTNISQTTSSSFHDMQLPEIHEYDEEIQNVGSLTFCESDDDDEKKNTVSPQIRSSRSKKPINYSDYLLSDESDTDSPFKVAVKKKSGSKRIKLNSTPDSKKASTENVDEISSDAIKETTEADYSVYNLDVSNSKKLRKKQKTKSSSVKSKSKKVDDVPKPLLPKCAVIKLKGGNLKFSKFETTIHSKSIDTNTKISLQNSCVSPGGILKKAHPSPLVSSENKNMEVAISEIKNIDDMKDGKQQNMLQTPRRVSFAPTDLVCKFEKMSESKAIADNKKVRRTSKSAFDLKEIFEEAGELKASPKSTDNSSELINAKKLNNSKTMGNSSEGIEVQKLNSSVLFDFTADTEIYTLKVPLNAQLSILPDNNIASSKPPAPMVIEETEIVISDDECLGKPSSSPVNTNKLSLKRNKISHETAPQIDFLFFESPMSLVKPPKRKSLFKEISDDCSKENIISDNLTTEEKDLLKKDPLNEVTCVNKSPSLSTPSVSGKKSSSAKSQSKVHSKISAKKNKKSNLNIKSLEQSPVLTDATNIIASTDESRSRRRSKQVSYKEPSLAKKLRRQ